MSMMEVHQIIVALLAIISGVILWQQKQTSAHIAFLTRLVEECLQSNPPTPKEEEVDH